jgi:uncharacterized FlaG/YvyC family protein
LKKVTNKTGLDYSQAQFVADRPLSTEEHALIEKLTEQVRAYSAQLAFDYDSMSDDAADEITVDPDTGEVIEPLGGR